MARKRNQLEPKQPERCKGCFWGGVDRDEAVLSEAAVCEAGKSFLMSNCDVEGGVDMLDKLIAEGEQVRKTCASQGMTGDFLSGEDYEKWIAKGILFMERTYPGDTLTKKFIEASNKAAGNSVAYYDTMMGILKALNEYEG
ncbi:hypothetical protein [Paenibacillus macerans]|uniref:Uncharacterized protein n=1 Tax=Paenibacillus macerans TaxID=44252 RepID=A0A090Y3H1_PAEMA|nr:hypothetical protein [Paenibacillus macerans]KFM92964.1 hypothetical protein DJ90_2905 [Paenibacillus macerans]MCY7558524.1 hypothetical protein [Paenibacillus macerans]MEC0153969.1 hypothetical protein [Paenibacillus macerans]SUA84760.1 Uncharacterised protein [Paenibacillus macerans]